MSGDQLAGGMTALLCLVLVASALAARRLAWHETVQLALVWAAILVAVVALIRLLHLA